MEPKQHKQALSNLQNKIGDKNILDKKVTANPKYSNVKGVISTNNVGKDSSAKSKFLENSNFLTGD